MRAVVSLARNGKNRLLGKCRISRLRLRHFGRACVEGRQVFLRRIRDQRRAVKLSRRQNSLLPKPSDREAPYQAECGPMQQCRLQESSPRELLLDEYIPPEVQFSPGNYLCGRKMWTGAPSKRTPELATRRVVLVRKPRQSFCRESHPGFEYPSSQPRQWCCEQAGYEAFYWCSPRQGWSFRRLYVKRPHPFSQVGQAFSLRRLR